MREGAWCPATSDSKLTMWFVHLTSAYLHRVPLGRGLLKGVSM